MATAASQTQYTPEDLLKMPDGERYELVDGQLVERVMSTWSSYVAGRVQKALANFTDEKGLGWVLPEGTGFQCFHDSPNKVRRPDVAFILLERMTVEQAMEEGHNPIVPDLVVEVLSPNDVAYEVDEKVQEFLNTGVRQVWIVNPQARTIEIHRATGKGTILRESDDLSGEDVLPGFQSRIRDFFLPPVAVPASHK